MHFIVCWNRRWKVYFNVLSIIRLVWTARPNPFCLKMSSISEERRANEIAISSAKLLRKWDLARVPILGRNSFSSCARSLPNNFRTTNFKGAQSLEIDFGKIDRTEIENRETAKEQHFRFLFSAAPQTKLFSNQVISLSTPGVLGRKINREKQASWREKRKLFWPLNFFPAHTQRACLLLSWKVWGVQSLKSS